MKWHHVLILVIMGIVMIPSYSWALNSVATGYRTTTTNVSINAHGTCRLVRHIGSTAYFVPTRTSGEWSAFRSNTPSGVSLANCPRVDGICGPPVTCTAGTLDGVSSPGGTNLFFWSCVGSNGGSTASCSGNSTSGR